MSCHSLRHRAAPPPWLLQLQQSTHQPLSPTAPIVGIVLREGGALGAQRSVRVCSNSKNSCSHWQPRSTPPRSLRWFRPSLPWSFQLLRPFPPHLCPSALSCYSSSSSSSSPPSPPPPRKRHASCAPLVLRFSAFGGGIAAAAPCGMQGWAANAAVGFVLAMLATLPELWPLLRMLAGTLPQ